LVKKIILFSDECVFGLTVNFLKLKGFDVIRAQDLDLKGASDRIVYTKAQQLKRILLTNDQGFGDIRKYPLSKHFGIIVLKHSPDPSAVNKVHAVLESLLNKETYFKKSLFIVDENKYRKRKNP